LPEVLRLDVPAGARRPLVRPRAELDPATYAEVERRVAAARAEAYAEGERAGQAAARTQLATLVAGVERAVGAVRDELVAQRTEATRASLTLAGTVAVAVLDATPPAEALELLARVEEAAEALDDDPILVRLNPADHEVLAGVSLSDPRLQLLADPSVGAGDARLAGRFGGAELTRERLLAAALEVLGEGAA
jgi:flagellar biosynthesis/type III secretory pathway protein FliH